MLYKFTEVGGYLFIFARVGKTWKLLGVDDQGAWADYRASLTGALGLCFGFGEG